MCKILENLKAAQVLPGRKAMFGRKVAQMQGADTFVTGATWKVVRIANMSATPQLGDFAFKH